MSGYGSGKYGSGKYGDALSGVVVPSPSAGTPKPTITVEVSWESAPGGLFVVGVSVLDGTDTLGATAFDEEWSGPFNRLDGSDPAWRTNATRWEVTSGRDSTLAEVEAGEATIDVRDPRGLLNPDNPDSPLHDDLRARLHPVRIRAAYNGVTRGVYYGWVRSIQWEPEGRNGIAQLECIDLFWRLDRVRPVIAEVVNCTTGQAIGLILDSLDWTDPALRSLSIGDTFASFSANGTQTGLELIGKLLEAERGLFYVRGDGVAVYEARNLRLARVASGEIVDRIRRTTPGLEVESVKTRARVTRTGGVTQEYEDPDARARWSASDSEEIENPYLPTDTDAMALAIYIVETQKEPLAPVRSVKIRNSEPFLLEHILDRNPGDRMILETSHPGGQMRDEYYIERRTVRSEGPSIEADWIVTRAPSGHPFIVDVSFLDGTDVLGF